jgi:hypothetical protein
VITPLPGPVQAELARYLEAHPQWREDRILNNDGFRTQVWAHFTDGKQDGWCVTLADSKTSSDDAEFLAASANAVARLELGIATMEDAVQRLAILVGRHSRLCKERDHERCLLNSIVTGKEGA